MKIVHYLPALFSLMMVPAFARSMPAPAPPIAGTEPLDANAPKGEASDEETRYPGNTGAVNEGGGSANTNGMSNGLSPNSSGSGTNSARASDESGIPLEGTGKKEGNKPSGAVEPEK